MKIEAIRARIYCARGLKQLKNRLFSDSFPTRGCGLRLQVRQCGLGQAKELLPLATAREAGMEASAYANSPQTSTTFPAAPQIERRLNQPIPRSLTLAALALSLIGTGCSNFDSRQQYWNQQLAGKLKAATMQQLKSFAANNQHEIHCNGDGISREGSPELTECYLVDARSKGALFNYRGKLFVLMKMTDGQVESHTFTTSTVLY